MQCQVEACLFYPMSNRCPTWCGEYKKAHQPAICKVADCKHQLNKEGLCTNPDCFHHTKEQSEVNPHVYKDWRL